MNEITVTYTDPETGEPVNQKFTIFADQTYHMLEFMEELDKETEGYR